MSTIIKISSKKSKATVMRELSELSQKGSGKVLKDFFGALPDTFRDPLSYQKQIRNEWE